MRSILLTRCNYQQIFRYLLCTTHSQGQPLSWGTITSPHRPRPLHVDSETELKSTLKTSCTNVTIYMYLEMWLKFCETTDGLQVTYPQSLGKIEWGTTSKNNLSLNKLTGRTHSPVYRLKFRPNPRIYNFKKISTDGLY